MIKKLGYIPVIEEDPWKDDVLDRQKTANLLTELLSNSQTPLVFNIDSPWGSGKTFFLERWFYTIKKSHPCVFFNAWKNDFSNSPFISFYTELIGQLSEFGNAKNNIAGKLKKIVTSIAPILIRGVLSKFIEIKAIEEIFSATGKTASMEMAKKAGEFITDKIDENLSVKETIEGFKKQLQECIAEIQKDENLELPMFIFIDELDRCRPTFAIELLENIKHLFDIQDVVFVVATDTKQLKSSIKSIYGNEFDANVYLQRFFDQRFQLPSANNKNYSKYLFMKFDSNAEINSEKFYSISDVADYKESFAELSLCFEMSLREQEQCLSRIRAIASIHKIANWRIQFEFLSVLIICQIKLPNLFDMLSSDYSDLSSFNEGLFAKIGSNNKSKLMKTVVLFFEYLELGLEKVQKELGELSSAIERHGYDDENRPLYNVLLMLSKFLTIDVKAIHFDYVNFAANLS